MLKIGMLKRGIYEDALKRWKDDMTIDETLEFYKGILDFVIENKWPTADFMLEMFGREELEKHHIYIQSENIDSGRFSDTVIVQSGSTGEFHFGGYDAINMWVLDDSEVLVSGSMYAYVFVHACDNSHVTVEKSGSARVIVKKHGKNSVVITSGDVKFIDGSDE